MNNKIALIDGDIIIYEVAFSAENDPELNSEAFSTKGLSSSTENKEEEDWEKVKKKVDERMDSIRDETGTNLFQIFLSPPTKSGYRHQISFSKPYKGNRAHKPKPKWFSAIRDYMVGKYKALPLGRIEADDALGIAQTYYNSKEDFESVICSKDKDLKQILGKNYNWVTKEMEIVSKAAGKRLLWKQMLTGDDTDNIIGCGTEKYVYHGAKKVLMESGEFSVVKGKEKLGPNEFKTKKALEDFVKEVISTAEKDASKALILLTKFNVRPVLRRVGVGPKEAESILDEVNPNQYQSRVLIEYINRFGQFQGIQKFQETFNMVYILTQLKEAEFHSEPWIDKITDCNPWYLNNNSDEEF